MHLCLLSKLRSQQPMSRFVEPIRPTRLDSPIVALSSLLIYTMLPAILVAGLIVTLMISCRVALTCLPRVGHTAHALNPSMHYTTPGTSLVSDQSPDYETTYRVRQVNLNSEEESIVLPNKELSMILDH